MIPEFSCAAVIAHTTTYSGSFERQLCAYATGQTGQCGVGEDLAKLAATEMTHKAWWDLHALQVPDDRRCRRPVNVAATPGWLNNGMGLHYREDADAATLEAMRIKGIEDYDKSNAHYIGGARKRLEQSNFEPASQSGAWTKEACERTVKDHEGRLEAMSKAPFRGHPAYLSVAVFVDELPPTEVMEEFKQRVADYLARPAVAMRAAGDRMADLLDKSPTIELTGFEERPASSKHAPKR